MRSIFKVCPAGQKGTQGFFSRHEDEALAGGGIEPQRKAAYSG